MAVQMFSIMMPSITILWMFSNENLEIFECFQVDIREKYHIAGGINCAGIDVSSHIYDYANIT